MVPSEKTSFRKICDTDPMNQIWAKMCTFNAEWLNSIKQVSRNLQYEKKWSDSRMILKISYNFDKKVVLYIVKAIFFSP